ncbi:MAG: hypothetical protein AAGD18_19765 [Actinomycetota bacterium]
MPLMHQAMVKSFDAFGRLRQLSETSATEGVHRAYCGAGWWFLASDAQLPDRLPEVVGGSGVVCHTATDAPDRAWVNGVETDTKELLRALDPPRTIRRLINKLHSPSITTERCLREPNPLHDHPDIALLGESDGFVKLAMEPRVGMEIIRWDLTRWYVAYSVDAVCLWDRDQPDHPVECFTGDDRIDRGYRVIDDLELGPRVNAVVLDGARFVVTVDGFDLKAIFHIHDGAAMICLPGGGPDWTRLTRTYWSGRIDDVFSAPSARVRDVAERYGWPVEHGYLSTPTDMTSSSATGSSGTPHTSPPYPTTSAAHSSRP